METIRGYLESIFARLPKTQEVLELKEEMMLNMEEKYLALKDEDKTENEAVGIVISEFGNIEEIAKEMGVDISSSAIEDKTYINIGEAEEYLQLYKQSRKITAFGVFLCLLGPSIFIFLTKSDNDLSFANTIGIAILLLCVAIAVGLFIYSESLVEKYSFIDKVDTNFALTPDAEAYIRSQKESTRGAKTLGTIVGISLILIGVIIFFIFTSLTFQSASSIGISVLLIFIGIGTAALIVGSSVDEATLKILEEGDFTAENKKAGKVIGAVAVVWWLSMTAIYLAWSFLSPHGFQNSWVLWPIAGVLFGAFAGCYSLIKKKN